MDRRIKDQTELILKNKGKILIIDDDPVILYLLKKVFIQRGFRVVVAKDGLEGIEKLRIEMPSVVITDLKTSNLSGEDLILSLYQAQNGVHIIIMTAYPNLYPEKKGDKVIKGYFKKPFDINGMVSMVENLLGV